MKVRDPDIDGLSRISQVIQVVPVSQSCSPYADHFLTPLMQQSMGRFCVLSVDIDVAIYLKGSRLGMDIEVESCIKEP
jgi:hypothetical protein